MVSFGRRRAAPSRRESKAFLLRHCHNIYANSRYESRIIVTDTKMYSYSIT
jgi:hypothetical protein